MQKETIAELTRKYGFDGIRIDEPTIRYIELLLGIAYDMNPDAIDGYMSSDCKNILDLDIRRISALLEIPFPEGLAGDELIRSFKEQVNGQRNLLRQEQDEIHKKETPTQTDIKETPQETQLDQHQNQQPQQNQHPPQSSQPPQQNEKPTADKKYSRLTHLLLEDKTHTISAFKLGIINDAISDGVDEDYLIELIKKNYDERELQRLVELYRITHDPKHKRKHGR